MGKDLKGKEIGKGISQRPDGIYMARDVDRYKKRQTIYDRNLKELRRKLEKEKYESEHGFTGENISLEEWFEEYMKLYKENKVKDTTLHRMRQTFAPCAKRTIRMMKLRDIRAIHLQILINELDELGYTYGTIRLLKSLLNDMFKKAMGNGYMIINPCDAIVMPKKVTYKARYLTDQEQGMFLEVAKEYAHYDIFCMSLSCGARIGEVLGLKWNDIDFDKKEIHIQRTLHYGRLEEDEACHFFFTTPKTETSSRRIQLLSETESILKQVRKKQLRNRILHGKTWNNEAPFDDMVFTTAQREPIRYGDVNRTIKTVVTKANIQEEELAKFENREPFVLKPFSPHCFRHTFVTRCKTKGVSYETIRLYVGHSDKAMTEYYDHNKPQIDISVLSGVKLVNVV